MNGWGCQHLFGSDSSMRQRQQCYESSVHTKSRHPCSGTMSGHLSRPQKLQSRGEEPAPRETTQAIVPQQNKLPAHLRQANSCHALLVDPSGDKPVTSCPCGSCHLSAPYDPSQTLRSAAAAEAERTSAVCPGRRWNCQTLGLQ